jgi:type IV pilus assembly protein PilQ
VYGRTQRVFIYWCLVSALSLCLTPGANAQRRPRARQIDKRFTIDFKEADIRDVLRAIGMEFGLNIVMEENVKGKVTVHFENVPLIEGLRMLLESSGFTFEQKGEIFYVRKSDKDRIMNVQASSSRLTLDIRNKDILDVLREISKQSGLNIVTDPSVKGEISGLLNDVPMEQGLTSLLSSAGFMLRKKTGIYEVTKALGEPGRRKGLAISVETFGDSIGGFQKVVSLDLSDADIGTVMQEIATQTGMNIVTYGDVKGLVNARLDKMLLDDALSLIFQGTNYTYRKDDNVYLVGDKSLTSPAAQALITTKMIKLEHIKADLIPGLLPPTIPAGNIKVIKEQNAILVVGTDDLVQQTKAFLKEVDKVSPQIMIEALVVEISKRASREIGVQGGYLKRDTTRTTFPAVRDYASGKTINDYWDQLADRMEMHTLGRLPEDFMVQLKALETAGKAKVRARPKVATLNGNQANIDVGFVRYYQTSQQTPQGTITQIHAIDAGIRLKIVPWASGSGEITTEIQPEVSNLSGIGVGGLPEISQRKASTTVRLQDGETILIGGLIQTSKAESRDKIPLLGDIPFLGILFSKTTTTTDESELLIYITPTILSSSEEK